MTTRILPEEYFQEEQPVETIEGREKQIINLIQDDNFIKYFVVIVGTVAVIACLKYIIEK